LLCADQSHPYAARKARSAADLSVRFRQAASRRCKRWR
jgi:hypothetical protein